MFLYVFISFFSAPQTINRIMKCFATGVLICSLFLQAVDFDDINNLQRSFNLTAYAVDPNPGPNNENRAETRIEIQVTDYNDVVPTFVEREKTASVSEAAPVGTILATFSANDRDVNPAFGTFEYVSFKTHLFC